MNFKPYVITEKTKEVEDTYIFRLSPQHEDLVDFLPGQYCFLVNETYKDHTDPHPFSIASAPAQKKYLEFCIKTYGEWTQAFVEKSIGETVFVSDPQGFFTWDNDITNAVFLLGGIGISPIMSILRTLAESNSEIPITLLYGNRTPETIAYKSELEHLCQQLPNLKIIHIFSDINQHVKWEGYRGFITKDIIQKEVNLGQSPTFFIVGPPIFIEKMNSILTEFHIEPKQIRQELLVLSPLSV